MVLCYIPGKLIIQSSYHSFFFQNTKQGKMNNRRKNKFVNTVCATANGKREEQNNKYKNERLPKYKMHQ